MNVFKVAAPWILRALGLSGFLNRVLHVPEAVLPVAAAQAKVTKEQWRAVEAVQQQIVSEGIALKLGG